MSTDNTSKTYSGQPFFLVWKDRAETLACLLVRVRKIAYIDQNIPITYAGRLDPMADGLVLILVGDACKQKQHFLELPKIYDFSVVLGIATDTFDTLGVITDTATVVTPSDQDIERAIGTLLSQNIFEYPPFSSRTVGGVPLFVHAKQGTLPKVLPKKEGLISLLECRGIQEVSIETLRDSAIIDIKKVVGDFRQDVCIASWVQQQSQAVVVVQFRATVSSGVYIRTLATLVGQILGVPAFAQKITRISIGPYEKVTI